MSHTYTRPLVAFAAVTAAAGVLIWGSAHNTTPATTTPPSCARQVNGF